MTEQLKGSVSVLVEESKHYPQEKPALIGKTQKQLHVGVPKENSSHENRVPLTPKAVESLTANGHRVLIESGAGERSNFSDKQYTDAGANLCNNVKEVFASDIVMKVEYPTEKEIEWMKPGKTVFSTIHQEEKNVRARLQLLNQRKITAIGYELLEDKSGGLPIVRAMSEIAGSVVIPIASEYLMKGKGNAGVILGGITGVPPTNVVIIGAGTVSEYATRAALGLGACVKIFDRHIYKLHRLKSTLAAPLFTSTIDMVALKKALSEADVVIGAVRSEKGIMRKVITDDMVKGMKKDAVIVDVSIDEGGCVETSEPTNIDQPIFTKHGIIHYCVPNIASLVPRTSTKVLSNIFTPILNSIGREGGIEPMIFDNKWFMKGVYTYKGAMTNYHLAEKFKMKFKDLSLLLAARF